MPIPENQCCQNCQYIEEIKDDLSEWSRCLFDKPTGIDATWSRVRMHNWCGMWAEIGTEETPPPVEVPEEPAEIVQETGLGTARMYDNRTSIGTNSSWTRLAPSGIEPGTLVNWLYNQHGQLVLNHEGYEPTDQFAVSITGTATIEMSKKDDWSHLCVGMNDVYIEGTGVEQRAGEDNDTGQLVVFGSAVVANGTTFELFVKNPSTAWVRSWHLRGESDGPVDPEDVDRSG